MKLNKEECMSVFMNLAYRTGTRQCGKNIVCDECENQCKTRKQYDKDCLLIEKLINEHFNNPPLKFEEIKDGDWVWDNTCKEWIQASPNKNEEGIPCVQYYGFDSFDNEWYEEYTIFEENRFYRKQVIENE